MNQHPLPLVDGAVITLSLVVLIGVGVYFARLPKDSPNYFKASDTLPAWAMGMSILAMLISGVTCSACPSFFTQAAACIGADILWMAK